MRAVIVTALALSLFVSGCVSCTEGPPVTARGITNASSSAGIGGYDLDILVTDGPGGDPIADAGVVAYWEGTTTEEWDSPVVNVGDDVSVSPGSGQRTVEPTQTARMKTGDDGKVFAHPPAERIIGVVAAQDGYTEEWLPAVATGASGEGDTLTVPLYHQSLSYVINNTWGPAGASSGIVTESEYEWQPLEAEFGATETAHRGYAARIVELRVTLTWTNDQAGVGDLGIGIGPDPGDGPTFFHDNDENAGTGEQTESVILDVQELVDHSILGELPIQIGPATKSGYIASPLSGGLAYTLEVEARFDTALADLKACQGGSGQDDNEGPGVSTPGAGLPATLLVLAALVMTVRRSLKD